MEDRIQDCCPRFDENKWDRKEFTWKEKHFLMESIPTLFHMPFPPLIGKRIRKMYGLAEKANAHIPDQSEALVMFHDPTPFRSEIYYSVTTHVPGANNTSLSGDFITMVFDGPYQSIPRHLRAMDHYLDERGLSARDYFVHYAYCPKCAKETGHNYMILFARL